MALKQVQHALQAEKAGHTGTLDPLATGMLPIALGEATKLCGLGLKEDKCYRVKARLGVRTDSLDADGQVIETRAVPSLTAEQIEQALARFRGEIMQVPPMFSALKQAGEALYLKARRGETVRREARPVLVRRLQLLEYADDSLLLEVECSSGTYVRTLVDDLGQLLGCGAHVAALRRSWVAPFATADMHTLESLRANPEAAQLLQPETLVQALPRLYLDAEQSRRFMLGQRLPDQPKQPVDALAIAVFGPAQLLGLGQVQAGVLHVQRLLLLPAQTDFRFGPACSI